MSADRVRWEHIQRVYELCNRNVSETARRLDMHDARCSASSPTRTEVSPAASCLPLPRKAHATTPVPVSRDTLLAIEQAAVRSWPALETADIEGWLWGFASGGSLRANSVAALAFGGSSVDVALAEAERRYRARNAPCRFTITEVNEPSDLDCRLAALGYVRSEDHVTMAKAVAAGSGAAGPYRAVARPDTGVACRLPLRVERRPQGGRPRNSCRPADTADLCRLPPVRVGRRGGAHNSRRRTRLRAMHGDPSRRAAAGLRAGRARRHRGAGRRPRLPLSLSADRERQCRRRDPLRELWLPSRRQVPYPNATLTLEENTCPPPPIPTCCPSTGRRSRHPSTMAPRGTWRARGAGHRAFRHRWLADLAGASRWPRGRVRLSAHRRAR